MTAPTIFLSTSTAGVRLEAVSPSRVQLMGQGGTPILIIDGASFWLQGPTAVDWRIQRQTWPTAPQYASTGDIDSGLGFPAANAVGVSAGGVEVARFVTTTAAVNYLKVKPSATGQPVDVEPDGTDAEIPLRLRGKGGAKIRIGQVTAATDPTQFNPDAYVELEDEDGTSYFIPCMSTAW